MFAKYSNHDILILGVDLLLQPLSASSALGDAGPRAPQLLHRAETDTLFHISAAAWRCSTARFMAVLPQKGHSGLLISSMAAVSSTVMFQMFDGGIGFNSLDWSQPQGWYPFPFVPSCPLKQLSHSGSLTSGIRGHFISSNLYPQSRQVPPLPMS